MPDPTTHRLTVGTAALLVIPPLMWAGNAVVGRMMQGVVPPVTLNFLRWVLAFAIMLPLAAWVLRRGSGLWPHWRRFALLGCWVWACTTRCSTWPSKRPPPSTSRWWPRARRSGCC
jgi:drug/metabolite transporter (DMT)-like permease